MRVRSGAAVGAALALLSAAGLAEAADLASVPISHASGFGTVTCHILNVHPTKDLIAGSLFIDDVNSSTAYGSSSSGPCTGTPPWPVPPGRGCGRDLITLAACDPPNACYCRGPRTAPLPRRPEAHRLASRSPVLGGAGPRPAPAPQAVAQ